MSLQPANVASPDKNIPLPPSPAYLEVKWHKEGDGEVILAEGALSWGDPGDDRSSHGDLLGRLIGTRDVLEQTLHMRAHKLGAWSTILFYSRNGTQFRNAFI